MVRLIALVKDGPRWERNKLKPVIYEHNNLRDLTALSMVQHNKTSEISYQAIKVSKRGNFLHRVIRRT